MSSIEGLVTQEAERAVLDATQVELADGPDAALSVIGPPTDPVRLRATLGILVRAKRFQEASELLEGRTLDENWTHLAALVYGVLGDTGNGRRVVAFADESRDLIAMRRTRLFLVEGLLEKLSDTEAEGRLLDRIKWSAEAQNIATECGELLEPLVSLVRANRGIHGDIQLAAVSHALICAYIQNEDHTVNECAKWLISHTPIPLLVAELCLRKIVDVPANVSTRLRLEHPDGFQATLLAAILERDSLNRKEEAFDALIRLYALASKEEDKKILADVIFETAGQCGSHRIEQAICAIQALTEQSELLVGLLRALDLVLNADMEAAGALLNSLRDDGNAQWLQAYATMLDLQGKHEEASVYWEKASELLPHPDLIRRAAQASFDHRRYQSAIKRFEKLISDGESTERDIEALAWALIKVGDYSRASEQLEKLVAFDPQSIERRMALAQCLGRCARAAEGVQVLKPAFEKDDVPLEAYFIQSQLLAALDRSPEAFALIRSIAADHWDDPKYLLSYVHYAHSAGDDKEGHEAFARLLSLQREGTVPTELLQSGSLEQLLKIGEQFRAQRDALQKEVIGGSKPWLLVEDVIGNSPTWAWALHTQSLRWLSDDAMSRAAFTIYATNGFTVGGPEGEKRLQPLVNPSKGKAIAVDLTALLTLHHLGRLQDAAKFVGKFHLPSSYGILQVTEADRQGQHQPSEELALRRIRDAVDRGQIQIISSVGDGVAILDEYSDDASNAPYRLKDLLQLLSQTQSLSPSELTDLQLVAHRPAADNGQPQLKAGVDICADLLTLRTLAKQDALDRISRVCNLQLLASQRDDLHAELLAHAARREAWTNHRDLWDRIAEEYASGRVSWANVAEEDGEETKRERRPRDFVHFDSVLIAQQEGLPLLADDRMLQVVQLNGRDSQSRGAFSTDHLILAMLEDGAVSLPVAAADFRKLMNWRYRFLIAPPVLLKYWADVSASALPGDALIDVAVYMHESLRDPGLHCGLEQSEPPMPMALKLVTAWTDSIADLLADVWGDSAYSDEDAYRLTQWLGEELIPSLPRGLWLHPMGHNLARFEASAVLRIAMIKFASIRDEDRASKGVRSLAAAIGLDEDELVSAAVETIHAIK